MPAWKCTQCGAVMQDSEVLSAPNPFRPRDYVVGCPSCLSIETLAQACCKIGCDQFGVATAWTEEGNRLFCSEHAAEQKGNG